MDRIEAVVAGAGVIGLAVARALAEQGREVVVLETNGLVGAETSSRNSEVIHAGIYYPKGSLKARLCVEGKQRLYRYCAERGIAHHQCGKLIVATEIEQLSRLPEIQQRAAENGVADLELLSAHAARQLEPELHCVGALLSPSTGIVDSHGLMLAMVGDIEAAGGFIAFGTPVTSVERMAEGFVIETGGKTPMEVVADIFINAGGHGAPALAGATAGFPAGLVPRAHFCKGTYFTLARGRPFDRLIYPVPEKHGLGIHVTLDVGGAVRFGPDVEWVESPDYTPDPDRAARFYGAIRSYFPGLEEGALLPGYAGIRPKLTGPDGGFRDFAILGPDTHGLRGHAVLFGIESPGLTASLAIGDFVATLV